MPPLPADFIHARACKPICEKYLTLPFKVPKLKRFSFETAIIERYHRRESSVVEHTWQMRLSGVWRTLLRPCGAVKSSPCTKIIEK